MPKKFIDVVELYPVYGISDDDPFSNCRQAEFTDEEVARIIRVHQEFHAVNDLIEARLKE